MDSPASPPQLDRQREEIPHVDTDFLALGWRHKWLLLLGVVAGLGGGYLHFTRQPPIYASSAKVQLVEPIAKIQQFDGLGAEVGQSLRDEATVMRSEVVLNRAVDLGQLGELSSFAGMSNDAIAATLSVSRGLRIGTDDKVATSTVFEISYQGSHPLTTQRVVQAIMDAYAEHLRSKHQDVGKETLNLIEAAKGDVAQRLEKLEAEYDDFKRSGSLIYRDGHRANIHLENADKLLAEKQSLSVRKTRLESKLSTIKAAIAAKQPPQAILLLILSDSSSSSSPSLAHNETTTDKILGLESVETPGSMKYREQQLVPLEVKLNEMLQQYGASHPTLKELEGQIRAAKGIVAEMEKNERELRNAREIAKKEYQRRIAETPTDTGIDVNQQIEFHAQAMQQQLIVIDSELKTLDSQYDAEMQSARDDSAVEIQANRFTREIARQQALYDRIVASLDQLDIMSEAEKLRVITLNTPKIGSLVGPHLSRSLGLGGAMGLLLMALIAYLKEWANKSYRSAEEIAEHLGLPVIGHIPMIPLDNQTRKLKKSTGSKLSPVLCTFFRGKSLPAEAYRAVRTAMYFSNQGLGQKVIQVTSAVPADGKSTIAANIAISIAQSGKSVLLLDGDLRRPQVSELLGVDSDRGTAWAIEQAPLSGEYSPAVWGEAIRDSEVANLSVMVAGEKPSNPAELLSSRRFDVLLAALKKKFDVIIIDSPPLLAVTDPSNIAPRVDAVILVLRLRKNLRPLAAQASRILETLEAKVLGVVVNGIGSREAGEYGKSYRQDGYYNRGHSYRYGYGYTYGGSYGGDNKEYVQYYQDNRPKKNESASPTKPASSDAKLARVVKPGPPLTRPPAVGVPAKNNIPLAPAIKPSAPQRPSQPSISPPGRNVVPTPVPPSQPSSVDDPLITKN